MKTKLIILGSGSSVGVPRIDNIHEGIYSYSAHMIDNPDLIETSKIIYFHGYRKPHNLGAYPVDDLIIPHWI